MTRAALDLLLAECVSPRHRYWTHEAVVVGEAALVVVVIVRLRAGSLLELRLCRLDLDLQIHLDVKLFSGTVSDSHSILDVHDAFVRI